MASVSELHDSERRETLQSIKARKRKELLEIKEDVYGCKVYDPYADAALCLETHRSSTGLIYDWEVMKHKCEWDEQYPEGPHRFSAIMTRLDELHLIERCKILEVERSDVIERILSVHTKDLVGELQKVSEKPTIEEMELEAIKYDSIYFNKYTYESACKSASCVLNLVENVAKNSIQNGFAIVRPPGHHAMGDTFCGYCYFNNVAIAAEMCLQKKLANKILIVDFDVHHGQATQQKFYHRKDVLYFSIHRFEHGTFWPNLRESNFNYIGLGDGKGYNINVPLNETCLKDDDYLAIVFNILLPVAYEYNPELIIISGGYDSCLGDEKGRMQVTPGFYAHLITLLSGLANGKIAVCLEGGYFPPSLAEGVAQTLKALLGDACPKLQPIRSINPSVIETINNVRRCLYSYWNCFKFCEIVTNDADAHHKTIIKFFGQPLQYPYDTRNCYSLLSTGESAYNKKLIEALQEEYKTKILPVGIAYDRKMLLHAPGENEPERPEKPERINVVYDMFSQNNILDRMSKIDVNNFNYSTYNLHDSNYVLKLDKLEIDKSNDIYFNEGTNTAIATAVSSVLSVVDHVARGNCGSGVAIVRPPGHHAEFDQAMGFCFLNNIAIAATFLKKKYSMEKILIIDFDIHHGNGTQDLFYNDKNVLYLSIHRFDDAKFFPMKRSGDYKYAGFGAGEGYNINIPFNKDKMSDTEYMAVFFNLVLPVAYSYSPEIVLISAGFDAGVNDPLGGYNVSPQAFGHFVQLLKPLARGKLVLCMEGGYNLTTLSYGMSICTKTLLGDPLPRLNDLFKKFSDNGCNTIKDVQCYLKKFWPVFNVNQKFAYTLYECLAPSKHFDYAQNLYKIYEL